MRSFQKSEDQEGVQRELSIDEKWELSGYGSLEPRDLSEFKKMLGFENVIDDDVDMIKSYTTDFTRKYSGHSSVVLTPQTHEQVRAIIQYCNERKLPLVPQGGNTGLVGGGVPLKDEVMLSLRKMSKIISFDPVTGILKCEAGCVLQTL